MLVYHCAPESKIPELVTNHKITDIYLQKEWTRDELHQEQRVGTALDRLDKKPKGHRYYNQFLFHPDDIPYQIEKIPRVFTDFRKRVEKESQVRNLVDLKNYTQDKFDVETTNTPGLKELGLETFENDPRSAFPFKGGATAGKERVDYYLWETKKLQDYKSTRNGLIGTDYSSKLSAWLAIGCLSAREVYHEVQKFESKVVKNQDTYWLIFELLWRDFFMYVSLKHRSKLFALGGILQKEKKWNSDPEVFENWNTGTTGEKFVDANMKELAATGFMSNRGRQNIANFWSMHKNQDWRIGAAYFEHMLIDYDIHSNYGNWMYNSGVGNDPRNRTFNIQSQASRYDPDDSYQELWLNKH